MILSFINICKVPREGLKPRASPSVFNTSLGTLQKLMNGKSCLIPLSQVSYRFLALGCFPANLVSDVVCVLFVLRVGSLKG